MSFSLIVPSVKIEKVKIRLAREYDLAAMEWNGEFSKFRKIYARCFEQMKKLRGLIWVAEYQPYGIIGQALVNFTGQRTDWADGKNRAYLHGFRVKPQFRHAGIGSLLLRTLEADLRSRGFSAITLTVARDNYAAQRLYQSNHYEIKGEEPGNWSYTDQYGNYQEVHEPAYLMSKDLSLL
ncbi:MAG TPA: GNAT family N-acetyltransferase [Bellilinea sp.]|mgnify:CR=1 FL=1|nr:GNAT family N-acetyltransferase [Bellilinea sp.]